VGLLVAVALAVGQLIYPAARARHIALLRVWAEQQRSPIPNRIGSLPIAR
jgi:hypothetical protein